MLQHDSTNQYHNGVCHEGGSRVHEHTDKDGYHCIGYNIYVDECIAHKECRQQHEEDDECIEHRNTARLLKVVFTVKGQIEGKAYHQYRDIEYLP